MTGLAVFTAECLLFWPSSVKESFGSFCGSMFVVGAGLSTLETGFDNFLAICSPPRYSEIRLNIAQGVQGVCMALNISLVVQMERNSGLTVNRNIRCAITRIQSLFC